MRFGGCLAAAILWAGVAQADCPDPAGPDVTGLYTGAAISSDGSRIETRINLYCGDGKLAAQFFTSAGNFPGTKVALAGDVLTLGFDTRAALGTLSLTRKGDTLTGSFDLAGDKGTAAFTRTGPAQAKDASAPRLDLTPAQWREDIAFFARELPKHHANAFFSLGREIFDAEIAALTAKADTANGDEMFVGLQAIANAIGDGHTGLVAPDDRRVMPIQVAKFGDAFRIVASGPGAPGALGTRVVKIGGHPVDEVWRRALTLTPRGELDQLRRERALAYLARGYALHGLGVTPDRNHALYSLARDDGTAFDLDVAGLPPNADAGLTSLWPDRLLPNQEKDAPFFCKDVGAGTVYCDWRGYQDLAKNARAMFALVDRVKPHKLIVDMRDNGGGDNTVGDAQIVKPLEARADLNRKGRLYVLIGAETFSAAMNNAAQFQDETNAILVGETIGEKPNSYQEPRQFTLPNSHLVVRASTLWYAFRKTGPNLVAPDKEIVPSWADAKAGRDPVLDWVLAQP
ncbi:MAG: hypothetical protein JOZ72_10800 [Alphaproteobacteria bacterium]|nr:hypothetical protein [Alphaproteobacteria bacterium]